MARMRMVAALAVLSAAAAAAAFATGSSPATGAAEQAQVWKGQRVDSINAAERIAHATAPRTLTITDLPTAIVPIDVGEQGDSAGDYFVLNLRVFDKAGEDVIGRGAVHCILGINAQTCDATIRLFGRGQITVTGTIWPSGTVQSLAVTGGTAEFRGVRGTVRMMESPELQVLVFHFTD